MVQDDTAIWGRSDSCLDNFTIVSAFFYESQSKNGPWVQAAVAVQWRHLLFWDVRRRKFVVGYRRFETHCRSHIQGSSSPKSALCSKTYEVRITMDHDCPPVRILRFLAPVHDSPNYTGPFPLSFQHSLNVARSQYNFDYVWFWGSRGGLYDCGPAADERGSMFFQTPHTYLSDYTASCPGRQ